MVIAHALLGRPGAQPLGGVISAFSTDHSNLDSRAESVSWSIPTSRDHSASVWVRFWYVISVLFRLLFACSTGVAQKQFSGEYGALLSRRSMLWERLGFGPMSARNCSKSSHRGSHVIPRPPYLAKDSLSGFSHLLRSSVQVLCSGVFVRPCVVMRMVAFSLVAHRHVFELHMTRFPFITCHRRPQRHSHSHFPCCGDGPLTVRLPKVRPVMSFMGDQYQTNPLTART